ncbi:hypothetical protein ADN00_03380 [Ornatilinea apprima]|uniref:Uncharacterized protein n=1 Tax=Ornatilinea apprima TaxID=1134406 RepID=A0A0P6XA55_9CHLR|nr:hypothetical protein [Ornatilinea apprima]KPL78953.1 hypothetical protein ADN00_03380 [Ornatilinea apprima]
MNALDRPYLPGDLNESSPLPLSRFLPPIPQGLFSRLIPAPTRPGEWLLDPLGTSPRLPLAAARAGYRVLVASNNPIERFILTIFSRAPSPELFQSALAELAAQRKGTQRLEAHLQELYLTACDNCGRESPAEAFLWRRGEAQPYARLINCPHCQTRGESPITPRDLQRLQDLGSVRLHRSRALERLNFGSAEAFEGAKEALGAYQDRPLYVLFTLLNKIEGLDLETQRLDLLRALILSACDAASSLWAWPSGRDRPRQMITPPRFRENNLWRVMENAVAAWSAQPAPVPLVTYPQLPPESGGLSLAAARLKDLEPFPQPAEISRVIAVFPRPNQAFWALCALWAGWLWGPETASAMRIGLERYRYDWQWHTNALASVLRSVRAFLPAANPPLTTLIPEWEPGFFTAALIGGQAAGFRLNGLAANTHEEIAQLYWQAAPSPPTAREKKFESVARAALTQHFTRRAEPDEYLNLHAATLTSLLQEEALPAYEYPLPHDFLSKLQQRLNQVVRAPGWLRRYESTARTEESGYYWPSTPTESLPLPLADRVEISVVERLQQTERLDFNQLYPEICAEFPGLQTPPQPLVLEILQSYATADPQQPSLYHLLPTEQSAARREDLAKAREQLQQLAHRMGYVVSGENPLVWVGPQAQPAYLFYLFASAIFSRFMLAPQNLPERRCILVFPGSRSRLVEYKLQRDPRLKAAAKGWRMLKFRHLRKLNLLPDMNLQLWDTLLDTDPPQWDEPTQIAMFSDL